MNLLPHDPASIEQLPSGDIDDTRCITLLLRQAAQGDLPARDKLYESVYRELNRIARRHLANSGTVSLDGPAVLHDAFLRMSTSLPPGEFVNRRVFFGYASTVMRNVIVDYVRQQQAVKRGSGARQLTLNTAVAMAIGADDNILELHEALAELERIDPRCHRVVEMRYFGGLTDDEVAEVLNVSVPTVRRDWRKARAFLFKSLRKTP